MEKGVLGIGYLKGKAKEIRAQELGVSRSKLFCFVGGRREERRGKGKKKESEGC